MFLLPAGIVYSVFFLWPLLQLLILSLYKWDGISQKVWVGLQNYQRLFTDPVFVKALLNSVGWLLAGIVIPVGLGLCLAILLTRSPLPGRVIFRAVYFLPQVLSMVVAAVIWRWIYNPSFGFLTAALHTVGLDSLQRGWLGEPTLALAAIFAAWTWVD